MIAMINGSVQILTQAMKALWLIFLLAILNKNM